MDIGDLLAERRRLVFRLWISRLLVAVLLTLAIGIGGFPLVLQAGSQWELGRQSQAVETTVLGWPFTKREGELAAAHAYNERLAASGQPVLGEAVDPFAMTFGGSRAHVTDSKANGDTEYNGLLDAGDGIMGSILIPKISVSLPVYHGTTERVLAEGSGHLYGTSLPVGGSSTHSVLTGHRGLMDALMFTRLDELQPGDTFQLRVMGKTLTYQVDRINVILPDDTSLLRIEPGVDRVTLMTCTPYGVNTHRLLVSGVRVSDTGSSVMDVRLWTSAATGVPLLVGLTAVRVRRREWRRIRHRPPIDGGGRSEGR